MRTKITAFTAFLGIIFTLSGCFGVIPKLEVSLKLKQNENWNFEISFHIPESIYYLSEQDFVSEFDSTKQDALSQGFSFDWSISEPNEEGNVVVSMAYGGTGYQRLNNDLLEDQVITIREVDGKQTLFFRLSTYSSGFGEFFLIADETNFLLEGGEILSTNGTQLDNKTVIWYNPSGVMSAEMRPPGANTMAIMLIVVGLGLFGLAVYKLVRNRHPSPISQPVPAGAPPSFVQTDDDIPPAEPSPKRFCINCGTELLSGAKFCIKCGTQQ